MENTAEYPGVTSFREWYLNVSNGMRNIKHTYTTSEKEEIKALLDKATLLPKWFGQRGIKASFGASKDVYKYGFTFKAADCTFNVLPATKTPQTKGVAQTSIEAYHTIDTRKQAGQVAKAAIELTRQHGRVNDRLVANYTGLDCARISARRIDSLEPVRGYILDGKAYYFKQMGVDVCPTTNKRVQWWAMLPTEPLQTKMF
jgi:hypothetical protein